MRALLSLMLVVMGAMLLTPLTLLTSAVFADTDGTVVVVPIRGEITTGTTQHVARAHGIAEARDAALFVVTLDTPGGLVSATQDIVALMLNSTVPTAAYVGDAGASAFSAGTFILLSAQTAAVHPNAAIGAAQPRTLGGDTAPDPKAVAAMESLIRSIAQETERDPQTAALFVSDNLTYTGAEALEAGMIDLTPRSLDELLEARGLGGASVTVVEKNTLEHILALISLPVVASLLLTIGTLGIIFSVRSGEFEYVLFFIPILFLGLWSMGSLELSTLGFILFLAGVLLMTIEILSPGFGIFGAVGSLLLIASFFFISNEPFFTLDMQGLAVFTSLGMLLAVLILFFWISHNAVVALAQKPTTGVESLPGKTGRALTEITPEGGAVMVDSYRWNAISEDAITQGTEIEVVENKGTTLSVRAVTK